MMKGTIYNTKLKERCAFYKKYQSKNNARKRKGICLEREMLCFDGEW